MNMEGEVVLSSLRETQCFKDCGIWYNWIYAAAAAKSLQSCPAVWPHRRQPTRRPCPWDSPGKNSGVDCHFLLQCMKVKVKVKWLSRVRLLVTPWTAAYQAPPSMAFPGKSTGVGCHLGFTIYSVVLGNILRWLIFNIVVWAYYEFSIIICSLQGWIKQKKKSMQCEGSIIKWENVLICITFFYVVLAENIKKQRQRLIEGTLSEVWKNVDWNGGLVGLKWP